MCIYIFKSQLFKPLPDYYKNRDKNMKKMLKEETKVEEFEIGGNLNKAFDINETKLDNGY